MPPTKSYVTNSDCNTCRDRSNWWMRTCLTMISLVLVLVGWSLWWSYTANASAAVIRSEQAAQSVDDEWIKESLKRIEDRLDGYHLPGGD